MTPETDEEFSARIRFLWFRISKSAQTTLLAEFAPEKHRATPIPKDYKPTRELIAWAREHAPGVHLRNETNIFIDHHTSRGSTFKDHGAAWRTWIRKAAKFGAKRTPAPLKDRAAEAIERINGGKK